MGIDATVGKFKRVMDNPQGRRSVYLAVGGAMLLFVLYLWLTR